MTRPVVTAQFGSGMSWDVSALLTKSLDPLFRVLIFLMVLLPSGSLFGVNVKMICFSLLILPILMHFVEHRHMTLLHLCALISIPAILGLWILLSQYYGFDFKVAVEQYREIVLTLVSAWIAAIYCSQRKARCILFLRLVLYAEVSSCILKLGLLCYALVRGVQVGVLVDSINAFFKVQLMGANLESAIGRIQFVADGLIPICMFILLRYRRILGITQAWRATVIFVILALSLIFTFSRYFWAFGALAFLLGMLFGRKDRFQATLIASLLVGLSVMFPLIVAITTLRFSAATAEFSDEPRVLQIPPLVRYFLDAPLLGHGLGSHTNEIIRDFTKPYGYEVQIYALAGQIGIVGLLIMGLIAIYYFQPLWRPNHSWSGRRISEKFCLAVLLATWFASGLFNPMLMNATAAISYASLRALAQLSADRSIAFEDTGKKAN